MSKRLKIRKNGQRVYEIRVSRGRDPLTGKQLTPYQMTWKVPEAYSAKVAEREAGKVEGEFIAACKAGKVLTKQEEIQRRKQDSTQAELERLEQASKPTFSEYMSAYLKKREAEGLAAGTLESYRITLSKAAAIFGTMKMEDISKNMIREYMANLLKTGGYKHSTYTRYHATVKVFFESAVEDAVISVSPMAELKRPRKPKDEKATEREDMKAYDEKQIANIFQQLDNEPLKWKTLIFFMLDTGCRRGEVCGVKWENINLKTGEVTICNNRQYTPGKGVYDTTPKNGKTRTVFLTETALNVMKEWKKQQALELFRNGYQRSGYCFHGKQGEGMNPSCISWYFTEFGRKYNIPNFHPHALRHTMATISIANGADVVSVSRKLGHSNVALTLNVYSHANEEAQRRANNVLANAIYNQDSKQA